jgi:hypothetical protein
MKDTYSIPVAAFKIGNLSGSDLEVVTVIHVEWPNRVHCRKLGPTLTLRDVLRGDRNSRLRGPCPFPRRRREGKTASRAAIASMAIPLCSTSL